VGERGDEECLELEEYCAETIPEGTISVWKGVLSEKLQTVLNIWRAGEWSLIFAHTNVTISKPDCL
jgi:hypothetical protein